MTLLSINTIMIVDDDIDDCDIFCEALSDINPAIECIRVGNGQEALRMLECTERLPQLIFLDLNMPRMGGRQCLAEIKKNNRLMHIPVVIYTTSKIGDDVQEMRQLGAYDFITKPFRDTDLKKIIREMLQNLNHFQKGGTA